MSQVTTTKILESIHETPNPRISVTITAQKVKFSIH